MTKKFLRNKFEGICYRCNKKVEINKGNFELLPKNKRYFFKKKWIIQHAECTGKFRGTDIGKEMDNSL